MSRQAFVGVPGTHCHIQARTDAFPRVLLAGSIIERHRTWSSMKQGDQRESPLTGQGCSLRHRPRAGEETALPDLRPAVKRDLVGKVVVPLEERELFSDAAVVVYPSHVRDGPLGVEVRLYFVQITAITVEDLCVGWIVVGEDPNGDGGPLRGMRRDQSGQAVRFAPYSSARRGSLTHVCHTVERCRHRKCFGWMVDSVVEGSSLYSPTVREICGQIRPVTCVKSPAVRAESGVQVKSRGMKIIDTLRIHTWGYSLASKTRQTASSPALTT